MLNTIPQDQNAPRQLDRLAAQSYLYSQAKKVVGIQLVLTAVITILWSFVIATYSQFQIWAAFYGLTVSLVDAAILDNLQRSLKNRAAKIQELFDCDVLQLKWHRLKVGLRPDPETIIEAANHYKRQASTYASLKNWYPESIDQVPLHIARIICQRTNLYWDSGLRRRYNLALLTLLFVLALTVLGLGFIGGMSLDKFVLAVLAPLSPAFLWGIRDHRRQTNAAETQEELKGRVEGLYSEVIIGKLTPEQAEIESSQLQDAIFDLRRNNPLIFDWVYKILRRTYEEQATKGAQELMEEALALNSQDRSR